MGLTLEFTPSTFWQVKLTLNDWGAAIAHWICLRLPSCCTGFESQYTIYAFILKLVLYLSCE